MVNVCIRPLAMPESGSINPLLPFFVIDICRLLNLMPRALKKKSK